MIGLFCGGVDVASTEYVSHVFSFDASDMLAGSYSSKKISWEDLCSRAGLLAID